jgi:hypothetical protein
MAEFQLPVASMRRLDVAATIIVCAAVVGLAYWYEHAYRRWARQHHPFAGPRARLDRTRATYWEQRAFMTELAQAIRRSTHAG